MGHGVVMVGGQASQHHVVGGRPDGAAPVTALGIIVGAVGGHGGHPVGTLEFFLVIQVGDEPRHSLRGDDLRQQCPVGCNGHHAAALAVAPLVIVESILFGPETIIDDLCQVVDLRLQCGDVLLMAQLLCHADKAAGIQQRLQGGINPHHVGVGVGDVAPGLHAGLIIHTAAPAGGPVGAVPPGAVLGHPLVVG